MLPQLSPGPNLPPESPSPGRSHTGFWLPLAFLILGLLITAGVVRQTHYFTEREQQAAFDAQAARLRNDFLLHTYRHVDILRTYQAEFAAHPYFFDDAFKRIAQVLKLDDRLPGIDTVGYARPGPDEATRRDTYVTHYLHHHGHRIDSLGIGIPAMAEPIRREAILRARDTGDISATGPVRSLLNADAREVFVVFLPLYRGGLLPESLEARRRNFVGAVFLSLQPGRLMESLFTQPHTPRAQVRLAFEGYAPGVGLEAAPMTLYDGGAETQAGEPGASLPVMIGGTRWTLELDAHDMDAPSQRWLPWAVLAIGLLLSLLGAIVVAMLQRSRRLSLLRATEDRSRRRVAETALHLRQRAIEASANAIVIANATQPGYPVEYVNPAFERMTGYTADEILGQSLRVMHGGDTEQDGLEALQRILREQREGQATLRNYRKDGELYWTRVHIAPVRDDSGAVTHFVAAKYDITQTRRYQETLEFQAWHDALTQLPNRHALRTRLTDAIRRAGPGSPPFWVAFLDLDNFKLMNDSLGHSQGDLALQQIAKRLREALQGQDMVARRGGDEFVFILFDQEAPRNALATLKRIMDAVGRPLRLGSQRFYPSCSIGVAIHPQDGNDPEVLIKHADMAMYHAKEQGRGNYQFYSAALQNQAMERVRLEQDLRAALINKEFELHFQPQLRLSDGALTSAEALVRWRHPERGLMPPDQFIPLAEETGMIVPLGEWVLRAACRQAARWRDAGLPPLRVAVNLSARQFKDQHLSIAIQCALRDYLIEPRYLELELTETLLADDVEAANSILQQLKTLGVMLSLDDFGTGYSSLAQIRRFPLDILKIDRSFLSQGTPQRGDAAIVHTIIELAHNLGLTALAEGVETEEQADFLRRQGCDIIQGYLISRPMPAAKFEEWARRHHAGRPARDGKTL